MTTRKRYAKEFKLDAVCLSIWPDQPLGSGLRYCITHRSHALRGNAACNAPALRAGRWSVPT